MAAASNSQRKSKHHICNKCNKSFELQHMYACFHGHYLCSGCYQKFNKGCHLNTNCRYKTNNGQSKHILNHTSFNNALPEPNASHIVKEKKSSMFPNPSAFQMKTIGNHSSLISLTSLSQPSILSLTTLSKRPITCPQYECRKTIAVSFLDMHFHHEHKHVATVITQLETRNCLEFHLDDLHGKNRNICLVLFKLGKRTTNTIPEDGLLQTKYTNHNMARTLLQPAKPFFIMLAAKMPYQQTKDESIDDSNEREFQPNEKVFFYVTSNLTTNFSYTLAASTLSQDIRLKYFGPVLSVNEDFQKLCDSGKGLILDSYQMNGMSNYCSRPVNLDLIIHEREDQINYYVCD